MKKAIFSMLLLGISLLFILSQSSMAADLPSVNWKFQSCCPGASPDFMKKVGLKRTPDSLQVVTGHDMNFELARAVSARTNGKFRMKVYAAGELFAPPVAYEALEKGSIDIWFGPPWAFSGRNPFGFVSGSLPYSITSHDQAYDIMYNTKFREIARRAYAKNNIYYITGAMGGADGLISNFPINSMADLKGKRVRGGGIKGKVLTALGAVDVTIAPAEIFTALERGVISGTIMPFSIAGEWGFFEKCKYVSLPPVFGNWWVDWACNMNAWKKLPREYQDILQEEADAIWKWNLKVLIPHVEKAVQDEWSKKGVNYLSLSDQSLKEIKKAVHPIWDDLAKMSPENAEVVKIYREYLKEK